MKNIKKSLFLTLALAMLSVSIVLAADTTKPLWQNQGQNSTHSPQGGSILLYSQGFDNETGLRYAWLETNESGQWQNKSLYYLNSFNDSKTIRNVTFTGNENKTVWIRLPKNSNVLNATVKLKGYPYPNTTINTTDETSDWYSYYTTGGSVYIINFLNGNDTNYSSFAECAYASYPQPVGYCHFMENYTTPPSAKGANIFIKAACPKNCMIEDWYAQCWNWTSNNSWIRIGQSKTPHWSTGYVIGNVSANITPESFPDCWGPQIRTKTVTYDNIANYSGLYEPNNGTYYEGKVNWLDESYTANPWLNIGEDSQFFNLTDDTSDWYGYYTTGGSVYVINEGYYHDQNWNSSAECAYASYPQPVGYCHFMENYTTPPYAKTVNVFVKAGCPKNCMIEDWYAQCWNWTSNNSWIRIGQSKTPHWSTGYVIGNVSANITPDGPFWECWGPQIRTKVVTYDNIANYSGLYEPNNGTYYEGKVNWFNRVNLDSDYEWQASGSYSGIQTINDFSKEINDYLFYCLPDSSGYCNVPLFFHSDTAGRIELSELNVTYISGNYLKSLKNSTGYFMWTNFSWQNSSVPAETIVGWRIHYQDGEGNRNATSIMTFKVKIATNCSLTGITNHTYEASDTPVCICDGDGITHLYRNQTLIDDLNNTPVIFGAESTNVTCNMTEGNFYAASFTKIIQTISKATPPLNLTNNVSWSVSYPTATNITGINCPSQLGCAFQRSNIPLNMYVKNNASQNLWNETFLTSENKTFWINLPKNAYIASAKLSLSGLQLPGNMILSNSTSGERTMWMEYDGTFMWVSGNYNNRTYKHKPNETPSTYYEISGPIAYDGSNIWTQNYNGGNIVKRDYSDPSSIIGSFEPPNTCNGVLWRGMAWNGSYILYYCDANSTNFDTIYWLNQTMGLEQGYCNSTNGCIIANCSVPYNITSDLTYDTKNKYIYTVFSKPGIIGISRLNTNCGMTFEVFPPNITDTSGIALRNYNLVWYGTGELDDANPEFKMYHLNNLIGTYPTNASLDVSNDGDLQWNMTGTYNYYIKVPEFKNEINSYLSSCTPQGDGTCNVPFVLHSDSIGIIQILEILVINNTATDSRLFGTGSYNYVYNTTGNDNYTTASISNTLTVNKGNASVTVSPTTQSIKYGTSIDQYCIDNAPNLDCILYRNETQIANNTNETLPIGIYFYKANISDTANYTNYQSNSTLTVANCTSNADCDDSIECTDNVCVNPGTVNSYCSYPNSSQGTSCGLSRDCPSDVCNGFLAEFYPDDGHDSCDGFGNCLEYSCVLQNSYCTDNDPFDSVNSLECGAACDQNSDCSEECIDKKWYSDYSCNLGTCGCELSNLICSFGHCGAECDSSEECGNKCVGEVRYYSGSCLESCDCSWSTENCDNQDGCFVYDTGCEDRDYYCTPGQCDYTYSNRNTDYNDSFVNYCSGDEIRKHKQQHNFYCDGLCSDHASWVDDELVEDCELQSGWFNTTNTQWIELDQCNEKEQIEQEYYDYTCSDEACAFTITNTQWIDTGNTRYKENGITCDDGMFCSVGDACTDGVCGGLSRDCSDSYNCTDDSCDETNDLCLNAINDTNCVFPEVCRPTLFSPPTGCGLMMECTNKTDGTPCDDGSFCNGYDECQSWNCVNIGPSIDCSINNLEEIATCNNTPDDYTFTWDFRNAFTSTCDENNDMCTIGDSTIAHDCDVSNCGAECDLNNTCAIDKTCNLNSCICEDVSLPIVTIILPMNDSYYKEKTWLNFTINEPASWIGYSLDNQPNKTVVANETLNVTDGPHNVIAYASDSSGNTGSSQVYFFYCKGDINKDRIIDIFDIVYIANAYSSRPGDTNWNIVADINDDSIIDIFDLVTIAVNFGKTC